MSCEGNNWRAPLELYIAQGRTPQKTFIINFRSRRGQTKDYRKDTFSSEPLHYIVLHFCFNVSLHFLVIGLENDTRDVLFEADWPQKNLPVFFLSI